MHPTALTRIGAHSPADILLAPLSGGSLRPTTCPESKVCVSVRGGSTHASIYLSISYLPIYTHLQVYKCTVYL